MYYCTKALFTWTQLRQSRLGSRRSKEPEALHMGTRLRNRLQSVWTPTFPLSKRSLWQWVVSTECIGQYHRLRNAKVVCVCVWSWSVFNVPSSVVIPSPVYLKKNVPTHIKQRRRDQWWLAASLVYSGYFAWYLCVNKKDDNGFIPASPSLVGCA